MAYTKEDRKKAVARRKASSSSKKGSVGGGVQWLPEWARKMSPNELQQRVQGKGEQTLGTGYTAHNFYYDPPKKKKTSAVPASAPGGSDMQKVEPQTIIQGKPKKKAEPAPDQMDALFSQLLGFASAGGASVDYEGALRNSEKAIRDAYAADIAAIRAGNVAARKDTARARRDVTGAYEQLAKSYFASGKTAEKQGSNLSSKMQKNAQNSVAFLNDNANSQLKEQADLAAGLGIQDAMPAASEKITKENAAVAQRIIDQGTKDANRQLGFAGNQQRYMERGGQNSRVEGTNKSADLLFGLQDFLRGQRAKIADLKGQRGRELAANQSSIMGSVADAQNKAQQETWDRLMSLAGLKLNIDKEKFNQQYKSSSLGLKAGGAAANSMPGAKSIANAQYYLDNVSPAAVSVFDNFLKTQGMLTGSYYDDKAKAEYKMTPLKAQQLIEENAKANNLSDTDVQLLKLAVWAQMGGN